MLQFHAFHLLWPRFLYFFTFLSSIFSFSFQIMYFILFTLTLVSSIQRKNIYTYYMYTRIILFYQFNIISYPILFVRYVHLRFIRTVQHTYMRTHFEYTAFLYKYVEIHICSCTCCIASRDGWPKWDDYYEYTYDDCSMCTQPHSMEHTYTICTFTFFIFVFFSSTYIWLLAGRMDETGEFSVGSFLFLRSV